MDQEITVVVGAQIYDLNGKLIEGSKLIEKFAKRGGESLANFQKSSNNAAFALTNLGRVAQDAPFGFIAIQNNLNPLLESFQMLKKETGSTATALKAMVSGLMGPAGLGIALSLVTTGILLYQQYTAGAAKETKKLASATDELASSTSKEIARLTILYDASQNLNIPLAERKKLVDELQKQFPTTFGNLTDEAILAGKAAGAYDQLTESMLNQAVIKGAESLIADKIKELASVVLEIKQSSNEFVTKFGKNLTSAQRQVLGSMPTMIVDEKGDMKSLEDYKKAITDEIANVRKAVQDVIGNFSASSIIGNFGSKAPLAKAAKSQYLEIEKYTEEAWALLNGKLRPKNNITGVSGIGSNTGFLEKMAEMTLERAKKTSEEVTKIQEQTIIDFENNVLNNLNSSFTSFFDDILTKGSLSFRNLADNILAEFSRVLSSAVAYRLLKFVLKIGGALLGPGGSFAASGLGKFLIPGFANGVDNFRGGLAMVGERGPELVNLPRGSSVIPNGNFGGVFIASSYIRGNTIVTSYQRGQQRDKRING